MSTTFSNSQNPPSLKTPGAVADQKSDQWAAELLDSVADGKSTNTHTTTEQLQSQSAVSTPGLAMPGSFPHPPVGRIPTVDLEQVKETAASALETAKEYVETAGSKVAPYLPEGVAAYIPSNNTAPHEATSRSKGGVDIDHMPSDGIAKLPEERRQEVLPSHDDESNTPLGKTGGVGPLPGKASESGVALLPDERKENTPSTEKSKSSAPLEKLFGGDAVGKLPEERRQKVLPSHDDQSSTPLGKSRVAGPLPGQLLESGVAVPPDEHKGGMGNYPNYLNPEIVKNNERAGQELMGTGAAERTVPQHPGSSSAPSTHGQSADRNAPYDTGPRYSPQASTDASTRTLHGSVIGGHGNESSMREQIPGVPIHSSLPTRGGAPTHADKPSLINSDTPSRTEVGNADKAPPPVPEKSQVESRRFDSDRATAGHSPTSPTSPSAFHTSPHHPSTKDAPFTRAPKSAGTNPNTGSAAAEVASNDKHSQLKTTELSGAKGSEAKKPGFMDKIKGEMKVMSGKLNHDETKIEEGKKMMGKN